MMRYPITTSVAILLIGGALNCAGCGTTRSTDTTRTATEQLLISDAIDRAVESMNLRTLAGQTVYLDDSKLADTVDKNYYISTLRQQLLASGCELRDNRDEAEFVVEARAGAIGTDRNDLLFGLPSMNVPQIPLVQPVPAAIPEIPIAKRKDQRGVAKIAVFAYHRATGTPVWQSGIVRQESSSNDVWIFGAGPFQRGTIYEGTTFAGNSIGSESLKDEPVLRRLPNTSVSREAIFTPPQKLAKKDEPKKVDPSVEIASHTDSTPQIETQPAPSSTSQVSSAQSISAKAPEPSNSDRPAAPPTESAYARMGGNAPLPQPRFNSPK